MKSLTDAAKEHGNPHKLLLQLVMARGEIRTSKMADVFQSICQACSLDTEITEDCTPDAICDALIESINPILRPLDLTVGISTNFSLKDESYFVMYATKSAEKSTKLLIFSDHEKLLFETWIEIMFVTNPSHQRGEIDATTALNACINANIRPLQAEAFLNKLEKEHILQKLQETDSYIFSPRAVKELEPILRTNNYEVPTCSICSNLVIARRFSHHCLICGTVIHNTCLHKMITLSNTEVSCPGRCQHWDNGGRCPNRFGIEALESMVFDKAASETITRPIEIVGVRGGTQAPEDEDEEEATSADLEEGEENDVDKSASKTDNLEIKKLLEHFGLEQSDPEDDDDEEMAEENNIEDNLERENAQDSAGNELETTEQWEEKIVEGGEDMEEGGDTEEEDGNGDEQMSELEKSLAEHSVEDTVASPSSNQEEPVKAKKKMQSGDALDELFNEMEEEDDDDNDAEE